ncbi:MAG: polysaccharide biosynthesis/export family protein [Dysgonamonadaceae bacterium]|jgi:polysaccharide export outer membrane protein|nr:polysaccharide biosynthesis/export family protein [Dysgonamonadaceae bacterium]
MKIKILITTAIACLLLSCQSTPKNVAYFQNIEDFAQKALQDTISFDPVIKKNDQLLITVSAPVLNQEAVAQFNLPAISYLTSGETNVNLTPNLQTYLVNPEGYISYPVLGNIKVAGMTKTELTSYLTELVSKYVADAIVTIHIASFQVMVLGEVLRPGAVLVTNERLTILEALAAAGDLTIFGIREKVLIIRENNDVREMAYVDLTKVDLFSSPYYFLHQNDVIVVEPNEARKRSSKFGAAENYNLSIISLSFSALSVISSTLVALFSIFRK